MHTNTSKENRTAETSQLAARRRRDRDSESRSTGRQKRASIERGGHSGPAAAWPGASELWAQCRRWKKQDRDKRTTCPPAGPAEGHSSDAPGPGQAAAGPMAIGRRGPLVELRGPRRDSDGADPPAAGPPASQYITYREREWVSEGVRG